MTTPKIAIALDHIDDGLLDGAINYKPKKLYVKRYRICCLAAVVCLCLAAGSIWFTAVKFSGQTAESGTGLEETEGLSISAVITEGTGFTEEEIKNFLSENEEGILSSVGENEDAPDGYDGEAETAAAKIAENAVISTSGYRHVNVTEDENILDLDYLNFLIIDDGSILGYVTLYRYDGMINYNVTCGGTWGSTLTKLLTDNPDEEFVLIYIGYVEIAIASDNTIYFLNGEIDGFFEEGVDYYTAYKCEENTINSSILDQ